MKDSIRKEIFNDYVAKFKELGYDVYSPCNKSPGFHYAYVTDGIHIIYFQISYWGGLEWSTCCVPNKETGTGTRINFEFDGKESVERAFEIEFGKPYSNFEHFAKYQERFHKLEKL